MVRSRALLFMLFPLLGLVLLAIFFITAFRRGTRWSPPKRLGALVGCVAVASYLISNIAFHVSDFSRIRAFRQEKLSEIRVGDHVLTAPHDIAAVCSTLNRMDWFESRHGGWGKDAFGLVHELQRERSARHGHLRHDGHGSTRVQARCAIHVVGIARNSPASR